MTLKDTIKTKLKNIGKVRENFFLKTRSYPLYVKIVSSIIHTTFFMKDYEIHSFYHIFFTEKIENLTGKTLEEEIKLLEKGKEEFLEIPPDHYRSTIVLIATTNSFKGKELPSKIKHLWFGIKGSIEFLTIVAEEESRTIFVRKEWRERVGWIFEGVKGWTLKNFT